MPESELLQAARLRLMDKRPYLSSALWSMHPYPVEELGTMAVDDRWRLYYDPNLQWTVNQAASVLYHEVNHLLRNHMDRAKNILELDPEVWNTASDCEINHSLEHEDKGSFNVEWPFKGHLPETYGMKGGELAENYYDELIQKQPPQGGQDCGSCADGLPRPYEQPREGTEGGVHPHEAELIRRLTATQINEAKNRGDVPGHLARWAEEFLSPKINWRRLLRAQVRRAFADVAGMVDYTYRRPSKRTGGGFIFPSLRAPAPKVAVVIDTSGSVGDAELIQATTEVRGVLSALGHKKSVRVISCDAAVHTSQEVWNAKQIQVAGGGGTDMGVGMAEAAKVRPDVMIVLTDGYTPWPAEKPACRVVVGLVGEMVSDTVPGYAAKVRIE